MNDKIKEIMALGIQKYIKGKKNYITQLNKLTNGLIQNEEDLLTIPPPILYYYLNLIKDMQSSENSPPTNLPPANLPPTNLPPANLPPINYKYPFENNLDLYGFIETKSESNPFTNGTNFINEYILEKYDKNKDKFKIFSKNNDNTSIKILKNEHTIEINNITEEDKKSGTSYLDKKIENSKLEFKYKKEFFMDEITDYINSKKVFSDDNLTKVIRYQYLINSITIKTVKLYCERENINENDIIFMYKGGTMMKVIYETYKNLGLHIDDFKDYFKRSDSDYSILINPNFPDDQYYKIYKDLMNISLYILKLIKKILNDNINFFLDKDKFTEIEMENMVELMNNKLIKFKNETKDENNISLQIKNIKKFIGVSIFDKNYICKNIENEYKNNNINYYSFSKNENRNDVDIYDKNTKLEIFKKNKILPTKRIDFYVTKKNIKDPYDNMLIGAIDFNLDTIINNNRNNNNNSNKYTNNNSNKYTNNNNNYNSTNSNSDNYDSYKNANSNGLYISINETPYTKYTSLYNKACGKANLESYFTLLRIKLNIIFYYQTNDNKFGFVNIPSELIDLSISKKGSENIHRLYKNNSIINKINNYSYRNENLNINFKSYSICGFLSDLVKTLYLESIFPWEDLKYIKRLNRLLYFVLLDLNNRYNLDDAKKNLCEFNNYIKFQLNNLNKIYDHKFEYHYFDLIKKCNDYIVNNYINNNKENENFIKYLQNINLILEKIIQKINIITNITEIKISTIKNNEGVINLQHIGGVSK